MNKIPLMLSKQDLACQYFPNISPHSAVNKLMSWLERNTELMSRLVELGYRKTQKQFTRDQIRAIYDVILEP